MKNSTFAIILIGLFLATPSFAQVNKLIRRASIATSVMDYDKAIVLYTEALAIEPNSYRANAGKGMVLAEFMQQYESAIPYLLKAQELSPKDSLLRMNNTLGKSYQYVGNYARALYYYDIIYAHGKEGNPDFDALLGLRIANCKYALVHTTVAPKTEQWIKNIGAPINTAMPEYGAVIVGSDLIFTSKRKDTKNEKKNGLDGKYFESMYKTSLVNGVYAEPVRYTVPYLEENSIFQSHNEAVVSVSSDGNILYIFRDGKLFEVNVNEKIKDPTKLNKNVNIARFQNHAAISPDGTIIYFTSKPKINEGGTDIFMATKNSSGNWSTPERLDMTINTDYDEDSPFLDSDGTLYFSSNGLPGYGGFDVYKTHKEDGKWTTPENLGQPINSAGDDLYFTLAPNSSEGFYSSARPSGNGDIDIYQVYYNVNRSENKLETPIAISSPIIDTIELNDAPYAIIVLPETVNGTPLEIQSVELAKTAEWQPHSLYFDFDKYELSDLYCAVLNDIIYELKRNNNLAFNINGYADSRGSTPYNKSLSLKRAMFVKRYMLDNGIKSNRIIALNAFGESAPENNCTDGVVCNESEYLLNRKVSMVIQKSNKIPKPLFTVAHRID